MSEQHQVRVEKVSRLREAGIEPYPAAVEVNTSLRAIREHYTDLGVNRSEERRVGKECPV